MLNVVGCILGLIVSVYYTLKIARMFTTPKLVRELLKEVVNAFDVIIELIEEDD